jgi:hypothetical protein
VSATVTTDKIPAAIPAKKNLRLDRAQQLVKDVKNDLRKFITVGLSLKELRDDGLFKELGYASFDDLAIKEFGLSKPYAYQHLQALEVDEALKKSGIPDKPSCLGVAAKLFPMLEKPEQLRKVWKDAVKSSGGKPVTAQIVGKIRDRLIKKKPPKPSAPAPAIQEEDEPKRLRLLFEFLSRSDESILSRFAKDLKPLGLTATAFDAAIAKLTFVRDQL